MDFKKATDELCGSVSHEELALALGVSVATIRQARLQAVAKAHRNPPSEWKSAIIRLAEKRASDLAQLIDQLKQDENSPMLAPPQVATGGASERRRSGVAC
jgi:hypothetical protein